LRLSVSSLSLGQVSTSFVKFAIHEPEGSLGISGLGLDFLKEGLSLFDSSLAFLFGSLGSSLGFASLNYNIYELGSLLLNNA